MSSLKLASDQSFAVTLKGLCKFTVPIFALLTSLCLMTLCLICLFMKLQTCLIRHNKAQT